MDSLSVSGAGLAVWLAFSFILVKLLIRFICRRVVRRKFSAGNHVAWFGVDVSVLSIVTWINHDVPSSNGFGHDATVLAYFILGVLLLGCCTVYTTYIYAEKKRRSRWRRLWTGAMILSSTFIGLAMFIATVRFMGAMTQ